MLIFVILKSSTSVVCMMMLIIVCAITIRRTSHVKEITINATRSKNTEEVSTLYLYLKTLICLIIHVLIGSSISNFQLSEIIVSPTAVT